MDKKILDLYSDYLISSFSYTTATGLSAALDGQVSHDAITRLLSGDELDSKQSERLESGLSLCINPAFSLFLPVFLAVLR